VSTTTARSSQAQLVSKRALGCLLSVAALLGQAQAYAQSGIGASQKAFSQEASPVRTSGATSGLAAPAPLINLVGQQARLLGEGRLRFIGLTVYQARLWSAPTAELSRIFGQPLALELTYRTGLQGSTITSTSRDEIERLGLSMKPGQLESWESQMRSIFPNVVSGDRILGIHLPGRGALFFLNDQPLGQVNDPAFSEAFFNIWLHPETRVASLRKKLLSGLQP
jgi:hypothetical protein